MTCKEAIAYLESYTWSKTRLGLGRTRELLQKLGDPQKQLKFIHVAGSNGKGSTCAMLESVLRQAGYRTGLYISPYLEDFRERIQVSGEPIDPKSLGRLTLRVRAAAESMEDHPSQFELVTALGMLYFLEQRCDVVVLEVGMGGELDSTNVIDVPEVAILTNIGLEHTEYLGKTLEKIALTKAGIIKPGCRCVCYDGSPEVTAVVEGVCRERGVPLRVAGLDRLEPVAHGLEGQSFLWDGVVYDLPLLGEHQLRNAAVALTALETLEDRGWRMPWDAVYRGLAQVQWPARFEILRQSPLFVLDGGHNPQCAQALGQLLRDYLPGKKVHFLLGVLGDKDWRSMTAELAPLALSFLCVTPENPRALPGAELAGYLEGRYGLPAQVFSTIDAAVAQAEKMGDTVACGSLYMAGHIRALLRQN